jgi:hypothetical protein
MEIGGYFELELRRGPSYHMRALALNTGRNAFEFILLAKKYKKVYLPYYTCSSILEPIKRIGLEKEFYHIDEHLEPVFDFSQINKGEVFVYTNYFGIFDHVVSKLVDKCPNLIIDNSQAFYSMPLDGIDTFYSARKFFGVPDGAYLYFNNSVSDLNKKLPISKSVDRVEHLLQRIEMGAEAGYDAFKKNEKRFVGGSIGQMSLLTKRILENIDYQFVAEKRQSNFNFLHNNLKGNNLFDLFLSNKTTPMVYPFLTGKPEIKSKLIEQKIFVPTYWPNVLKWCDTKSLEYKLAKNILHLPVDQRFGEKEMQIIVENINRYL